MKKLNLSLFKFCTFIIFVAFALQVHGATTYTLSTVNGLVAVGGTDWPWWRYDKGGINNNDLLANNMLYAVTGSGSSVTPTDHVYEIDENADGSENNTRIATFTLSPTATTTYWFKAADYVYLSGIELEGLNPISDNYLWYAYPDGANLPANDYCTSDHKSKHEGDTELAVASTTVSLPYNNTKVKGFRLIKGDRYKNNYGYRNPESADVLKTWNCTNTTPTLESLTSHTFRTTAEDTYWITGLNAKDAFLYGYDVEIVDPNATPDAISKYHLYTPTVTMKNGHIYDDNFILYKGETSPNNVTNTKIEVMSQMTPTYNFGANDHLGFKIDDGKKGIIRAYFTPKQALDLSLTNLNGGWNSSYDADTKTITFNYKTDPDETNATTIPWDSGKGWFWGAQNPTSQFASYNVLAVELNEASPVEILLVAQDNTGKYITAYEPKGCTSLVLNLDQEGFDKANISQIYIQIGNFIPDKGSNKIVLKSAQALNSNVILAKGEDANTVATAPNLAPDCKFSIYHGTTVLEYAFDEFDADQMFWLSGAMNLAAVEVLYDIVSTKEKIVEWYVNKNTKMIVGSDDPTFTCNAWGSTTELNYQKDSKGNDINADEFVTFYVSGGQRAKVSWMMPQVSRDIVAWDKAVAAAYPNSDLSKVSIDESKLSTETELHIKNCYGRHTVDVTVINAKDASGGGTRTFGRDGLKGDKTNINSLKTDQFSNMRGWYASELLLPDYEKIDSHNANRVEEVLITATQKLSQDSIAISPTTPKEKTWKVFMRFIFIDAPVCNLPSESAMAAATSANVTVTGGQKDDSGSYFPYFITTDSSDPVDLNDRNIGRDEEFSTSRYNGQFNIDYNCFVKAAQFIETPYPFYEDCKGSQISRKFRLLSNEQPILLKDRNDTYYVHKPTSKTLTEHGGKIITIKDQTTNSKNTMTVMLGTDARPYYRSLSGTYDFRIGATKWSYGSNAQDAAYRSFIDPYQYVMFGGEYDRTTESGYCNYHSNYTDTNTGTLNFNPNGNPNTECNDGIGGKTTEDGGLFLAPIAGDFVRLEPEYDGVVSLWVRQNGSVEYETQENGEITRRPTYVVDENGKIMRASVVKPTAKNHLGVNGMYAVNAGNSELRASFEHTWLYGVSRQVVDGISAADEHWMDVNDPDGINDYRSSYLLYGMWFSGLDIDATRSSINSAKYASRFNWTGTQPLYRGEWLYNQENLLGLMTKFAKYGYEVPNFAYVRYRIPVKAGKTYYVGERGSKNGFIGVQFEPLECNINYNGTAKYTTNDQKVTIEDYRYADNPDVKEDRYTRTHFDWTKADGSRKTNTRSYSETSALATYGTGNSKRIETLTINPELTTNQTAINNLNIDDYNLDGLSYKNVYGVTANVTVNRTFTQGYWHPIVLPFSVSETKLKKMFGENVKVLYLDPYDHSYGNEECEDGTWRSVINPAIDNSILTFTYHRYQMLYANVPAYICPSFDGTGITTSGTNNDGKLYLTNPTFERVTIEKSNLRNDGTIGYDIGGGYEVVGSYDKVSSPGVEMYFISNSGGSTNTATMYRDADGNTEMKGTRCWIQRKGVKAAPLRAIGYAEFTGDPVYDDNHQAGIEDVIMDNNTIEMYDDDNVYDMLGRIVGHGSMDGIPQGVYIFQGKKVYVR